LNKEFYVAPDITLWKGRVDNPESGNQYWYQRIILKNLLTEQIDSTNDKTIALIGYAVDEGVTRNQGRAGSSEGPNTVKKTLAKFPAHFSKPVIDFGNIICSGNDLENTHLTLEKVLQQIAQKKYFPVVIGGGHDLTFPVFKGIFNEQLKAKNLRIGIINFDSHFDIRPFEEKANSGTPFYQILALRKEFPAEINYCVIGLQQQGNTDALFELANKLGVKYISNYESDLTNLENIKKKFNDFVEQNDYIYLSIDMDGFSSAYAPGVSAPSPLGFTPFFVIKLLNYFFNTGKVIGMDVAELNPKFDKDGLTSNLASKLIDISIQNYFNIK